MLFLRTFVFFSSSSLFPLVLMMLLPWFYTFYRGKGDRFLFFFPLLGAFIRLPHTLFLFRSK